MGRLGYSGLEVAITSCEENASKQTISASLLISSGSNRLYCPLFEQPDASNS